MAKANDVPKIDTTLQTNLGAVVRVCRKNLGITQEELAWRADVHRTYIADIERGARNVTLRTLVGLAEALQVSVGNLLSEVTVNPKPTRQHALPHAANPGQILLVEDSETDSAMAVRAFKRGQLTNPLKVVRDAETALEYLLGTGRPAKRVRPQLILLDLNLPQMSGIEFLRTIKADVVTRDIPVVVLTVSRSDRMIIECARLGAENYIIKPLGVEGLVRVAPKLNLHLTLGSAASPAAAG